MGSSRGEMHDKIQKKKKYKLHNLFLFPGHLQWQVFKILLMKNNDDMKQKHCWCRRTSLTFLPGQFALRSLFWAGVLSYFKPQKPLPSLVEFLSANQTSTWSPNVLSERRHGPLLDVSGALWVFLQGLHDLTVVQHESHEPVLPLSFGRRRVDRPDQLQLLQVLEGLRTGE